MTAPLSRKQLSEAAPSDWTTTLPDELDPLMQKVEDALALAATLGNDAFDVVYGRGLYYARLDIQSDIATIRRHLL